MSLAPNTLTHSLHRLSILSILLSYVVLALHLYRLWPSVAVVVAASDFDAKTFLRRPKLRGLNNVFSKEAKPKKTNEDSDNPCVRAYPARSQERKLCDLLKGFFTVTDDATNSTVIVSPEDDMKRKSEGSLEQIAELIEAIKQDTGDIDHIIQIIETSGVTLELLQEMSEYM